MIDPDRPHKNIQWFIHFSCWMPKATGTHSEYILHISVPQQQWLHEHASVSHYMCTACLVVHYIGIIWLLYYI